MKKLSIIAALACIPLSFSANAFDVDRYTSIATDSIGQVISSTSPDVNKLISQQEELMTIAIAGCNEYSANNPEAKQLLDLVVSNSNSMKSMSLDDIEEQWHDHEFPISQGIDMDSFGDFSSAIMLMESVLHPATSIVALKEFSETGDTDLLGHVKDELSEVIEDLKLL